MNLHILALGKVKESHWREALSEYSKRLSPFAKLKLTEIKEEPFRKGDVHEKIKEKEAQKVLPYIERAAITIALHERGDHLTSPALASWLQRHSTKGEEILFIIGGPLGFHDSVLKAVDKKLSLSAMTLPHQLARVVLVEQLYRAATIQTGKQYHY